MKPLISSNNNFSWMFGALILLLLSNAVFNQLNFPHALHIVNISLMLTIAVAVLSVNSDKRQWLNWKIGLSCVIATLLLGDSLLQGDSLVIYQLLSILIFLLFTLYLCWQQVMFSGKVDRNKIIGSICIYILLALIWAFGYLILEHLFPGSFSGLEDRSWQHNLGELLYYSLVTLTTLGYGEITPTQPMARFLAYAEAVTGVFYTTVLVASLIGMRLAHYEEKLKGNGTPKGK